MRVNNFYVELLNYAREPVCQRKIVRRILEQRVIHYVYAVELNV